MHSSADRSHRPWFVNESFLNYQPLLIMLQTVLGCQSSSWISSRSYNGRHANVFHRSGASSFSGSYHWCTWNIHQRGILYCRMDRVSFYVVIGRIISDDLDSFRFGCYFTPDSEFAWRFPFSVVAIWGGCLLAGSFYGT